MIRRTLIATLAAAALILALAGSAVAARPVFVFQTVMTGEAEVPGPGDLDAIGHATIVLEPDSDTVCWIVSWTGIDGTVTASHIHGPATETQAAGVVLPLFVEASFNSTGVDQGCTNNASLSGLIDAIIANPAFYYVNVHSTVFPAGAIRGQLG